MFSGAEHVLYLLPGWATDAVLPQPPLQMSLLSWRWCSILSALSDATAASEGLINCKHVFLQSDWSVYIPAQDTKTWPVWLDPILCGCAAAVMHTRRIGSGFKTTWRIVNLNQPFKQWETVHSNHQQWMIGCATSCSWCRPSCRQNLLCSPLGVRAWIKVSGAIGTDKFWSSRLLEDQSSKILNCKVTLSCSIIMDPLHGNSLPLVHFCFVCHIQCKWKPIYLYQVVAEFPWLHHLFSSIVLPFKEKTETWRPSRG